MVGDGERGVMSLRLRLIIGPAAVMIVAIAVALGLLVHQARMRVAAERVSSMALARDLVAESLANLPAWNTVPQAALAQLAARLPTPRHVRLTVMPAAVAMAESGPAAPEGESAAPAWFVRLTQPPAWEERHDIMVAGIRRGQVVITSDPDDEIAEIWQEFRVLSVLLLVLTALFVALVVWSVGRALRPLAQVRDGLGRLAAGDYAASLPPLGIAELVPLGSSFNHLADSLRRLTADNHLLMGKLISLQESERSQLAHELHDELGPCLFGIRAQATCLVRMTAGAEAASHARLIHTLTDDLQSLNRRILRRLRPMALADLGLGEAVRRLVEDWRERCPSMVWDLRCGDLATEPDGRAALAVYRIVQECLTNAARHSGARRVVVGLAGTPTQIAVTVQDDGTGLPDDFRKGFGVLGMAERAQALGGCLRIDDEGGVTVTVLIPTTPPEGGMP